MQQLRDPIQHRTRRYRPEPCMSQHARLRAWSPVISTCVGSSPIAGFVPRSAPTSDASAMAVPGTAWSVLCSLSTQVIPESSGCFRLSKMCMRVQYPKRNAYHLLPLSKFLLLSSDCFGDGQSNPHVARVKTGFTSVAVHLKTVTSVPRCQAVTEKESTACCNSSFKEILIGEVSLAPFHEIS